MSSPKAQSYISSKIHRIVNEGVRRNTHAPVSKANPRRPVSQAQAQAIALSEARRKGYKIPRKGR